MFDKWECIAFAIVGSIVAICLTIYHVAMVIYKG